MSEDSFSDGFSSDETDEPDEKEPSDIGEENDGIIEEEEEGSDPDESDAPEEGEDGEPEGDEPPADDLRVQLEVSRRATAEAQHAARSQAGRIAASQRQIQDLQAKITALTNTQSVTQQGMTDDQLKALATEYPELAGPILSKISGLEKQLQDRATQINDIVERMGKEEVSRHVYAQKVALTQVHPDWPVIRENPEFQQWMGRKIAEGGVVGNFLLENSNEIVAFEQVSIALNEYKREVGKPAGQKQEPNKRQRQLESSSSPTTRRTGARVRQEDSFSAGFNS